MGENIYHEFNILTEIAGGLSVTMPFEDDFLANETEQDLKKLMKRNPKLSYEDACRAWRFVGDVAASSMGVWYQIGGVHGGPQLADSPVMLPVPWHPVRMPIGSSVAPFKLSTLPSRFSISSGAGL